MKKIVFVAIMGILAQLSTMAIADEGSMIGGGEVRLEPALVCDATGIDVTHPVQAIRLEVAYEAMMDGSPVPGMTLKVLTKNESGKIVNIYQTATTEIPSLPLSLKLYDYVPESEGARVVGMLKIDDSEARFSSQLRPSTFGYKWGAEELILSNCAYVADSQDQ